jgi:hypothetical protein
LGSLNLNDIVWLRSYEGMNRFNLLELDKVSVFRDDEMFSYSPHSHKMPAEVVFAWGSLVVKLRLVVRQR